MTLGPIAFLSPWLLAGLIALPVIWWLLRTIPPRPRRLEFPPTRILVGIENREKTPAQTPWWLTLIRMLAAALVILALAEPVLNPNSEKALSGSGPVVLVVDNGWSSAAQWGARTFMIERLIAEAEGRSRPVLIVPTANPTKALSLKVEAPAAARSTAAAVQPQPFAPERVAALPAMTSALTGASDAIVVWLADGIDHDGKAREFADRLSSLAGGKLSVVDMRPGQEALGAVAGVAQGGRLDAQVLRAEGGPRTGTLHAMSARAQRLGEAPFTLGAGDTRALVTFDMPLELRNQVTRVEIAGERSAGAVHLLDARSQWHRVGLVSGASREQAQPLLAPLYYIERALQPFSEIAKSDDSNLSTVISTLIKRNVSALMLADIGTLPHDIKEQVEEWVKKGGILVRFAGPRLENGGDDLLPVPLRLGGRTLGGALSWATPQPLAPFGDDSLFAGLTPPAEVLVNKQVLADPAGLGPDVKVWARLRDGTPLVTAARRGNGQVIFFHVTANSDWSNLSLSGLFVEMLRRIASLGGTGGSGDALAGDAKGSTSDAPATVDVLAPLQVLDGFGLLKSPPPTTQAIAAAKIADARPSAEHPPGYYGPAGSPRALNLMTPKSLLKPLPAMPAGTEKRVYEGDTAQPIKPQLLTLALALLFADILAVLLLQSGGLLFARRAGRARAAGLALLIAGGGAVMLIASPADAQAQTRPAPGRSGPEPHRRWPHHPGHRQGHLRLRAVWRRRHRRGEPPGPRRPRQVPDRPHGGRARRAVRGQHPDRRARLLPDALLARARQRPAAARGDAGQDRRLHEAGRHDHLRHQGLCPGPARRLLLARRRRHAAAAPARQPRHPAPGAGARAPRADQVVLPAAHVPRPLGRRPAVGGGRGAARQRPGPTGPARRRGELDPDHVERLRRRLGAR